MHHGKGAQMPIESAKVRFKVLKQHLFKCMRGDTFKIIMKLGSQPILVLFCDISEESKTFNKE